jgi:hypothetical protein
MPPNSRRSRGRPRGLWLGRDRTGPRAYLGPQWLKTHVHILGPTGSGKTRLLLHLFKQLVHVPRATVVLVNPKGNLGRMARDYCPRSTPKSGQ